jgi:hypothetical protein
MTLTIALTYEQTAVLISMARATGLAVEEYVRQVLEHELTPDWLQRSCPGLRRI